MKLTLLRRYSDRLRATPGVLEKEEIIRHLLRKCRDDEERVIAAMLLVGKLAHPGEGLTTGIKEAFIAKDLGLESGRHSLEDIAPVAVQRAEPGKNDYDLGDIWAFFRSYLEDAGRKTSDKSRIVNRCLFDLCKEREDVPFLLQILCEKVNNGVDDKTILNALYAHIGNERSEIARAYGLNPSLAYWVKEFFDPSEPFLTAHAQAMTPLDPQACARVDKLETVLEWHGNGTLVQPKLDGERVQIHVTQAGGIRQVRLFSRSQKDITEDYPEVTAACTHDFLHVEEHAIFDGELVAMDEKGNVAPFALLQRRLGRKKDRHRHVEVGVILYDLLLWDGAPVSKTDYTHRLKMLEAAVTDSTRIRLIESKLVYSRDDLLERLMAAQEAGDEGLVCKDPDSLPSPGTRSKDWIKLKPAYMEDMQFSDTFDLVVVGYTKGRGKRHGSIGALWVAVRDADKPHLALWPVCKVGTGLKDEDLLWWKSNLEPVRGLPDEMATAMEKPAGMDSWVKPEHVVEVGAIGGLTKTDKYAGFSLRFPVYIRRRNDKTPRLATATDEVEIP